MKAETAQFSFLNEGRPLEDHEYTLVSQADSYEKMVGRLVTATGLLDGQSTETSIDTLVRIHTGASQYQEHYWHNDHGEPVAKDIEAHEELYEQTEDIQRDVPLLREALKMQREMGRHSDTVLSAVYVVRLLVLQELLAQPKREIPESA